MTAETKSRCSWCLSDPLYIEYHDQEWGVPEYDDQKLFEQLSLEAFQAGLSWITILKKREHFREAFDQFNISTIAEYNESKILSLLSNEGIVRHRGKIEATINNARLFLDHFSEPGSFSAYLWSFTGGKPQTRTIGKMAEYRSTSLESDRMSKGLKKLGFRFVGSTTCYAFMQASGMYDEHLATCWKAK